MLEYALHESFSLVVVHQKGSLPAQLGVVDSSPCSSFLLLLFLVFGMASEERMEGENAK